MELKLKRNELRPCEVFLNDGAEFGLFHRWVDVEVLKVQVKYRIEPELMEIIREAIRNGTFPPQVEPIKVVTTYGIVELASGGRVVKVPPEDIRFLDQKHKEYIWEKNAAFLAKEV